MHAHVHPSCVWHVCVACVHTQVIFDEFMRAQASDEASAEASSGVPKHSEDFEVAPTRTPTLSLILSLTLTLTMILTLTPST